MASEYRSGSSGVSQGRVATKLEAWHQQRSIAGSTSTDLEGHSQLVGFIYSMLARKSEQTASAACWLRENPFIPNFTLLIILSSKQMSVWFSMGSNFNGFCCTHWFSTLQWWCICSYFSFRVPRNLICYLNPILICNWKRPILLSANRCEIIKYHACLYSS